MFSWVFTFFLILIAAALLAFTGIEGTPAQVASVIFVAFLVLLLMSFAVGAVID